MATLPLCVHCHVSVCVLAYCHCTTWHCPEQILYRFFCVFHSFLSPPAINFRLEPFVCVTSKSHFDAFDTFCKVYFPNAHLAPCQITLTACLNQITRRIELSSRKSEREKI